MNYLGVFPTKKGLDYYSHAESNQYDVECSSRPN